MERRTFVKGLAAGVMAAGALPACAEPGNGRLQGLVEDLGKAADDAAFWKRVRQEFLLSPGLVHFNSGSTGASPRVVVEAVCSFLREMEADPQNNVWGGLGAGTEEVRARAAAFIGADLAETAITRNTSEGMSVVASGLQLKAGDEVLTTNHEHGGGMVCWQYLAKHAGVKIRYLEMPVPPESKDQILQLVSDHITERTRVCSFSHVETILGTVMPMAEIAAITRPRDILLVCDGAQVPGMLEVDVKALQVDTYASSSHKWLLAPKGSGILYVRREVQERVQPLWLAEGFATYNAAVGTRDVHNILGHGVAIDFHNAITRPRVEARCRQLNRLARELLARIPALRLLSAQDPALTSGMVTYAVDPGKGSNGEILGRLYKEHRIQVKAAQPTYAYVPDMASRQTNYNAVRISTHIFNSEEEVAQLAEKLGAMLA
ncbi:MAG: aminotransferase class V-fold PLP-dependent enzyme [Candidatus Latescibacterota bacterium]